MTAAGSGDGDRPRRTPRPCPICGRMSVARYHPFCSLRCAQVDLGRWLGGHYRIPTDERPDPGAPPLPDDDADRD